MSECVIKSASFSSIERGSRMKVGKTTLLRSIPGRNCLTKLINTLFDSLLNFSELPLPRAGPDCTAVYCVGDVDAAGAARTSTAVSEDVAASLEVAFESYQQI